MLDNDDADGTPDAVFNDPEVVRSYTGSGPGEPHA
jgi:ABC-type branched-subunit amino acid transport system ATPase component